MPPAAASIRGWTDSIWESRVVSKALVRTERERERQIERQKLNRETQDR